MATGPLHIATQYLRGMSGKVADRFLQAKTWANPAFLLTAYEAELDALKEDVAEAGAVVNWHVKSTWMSTVRTGRALAEWVIQTRAIPAGKSKALELTARLFQAQRTSDPIAWFHKNKAALDFLVEAAKWGERAAGPEGGLELAMVGPFKVHNTIGADAKHFAEIQALVESAIRALSTTRDFKKVLYGDVFVVGQLASSKTAAWYNVKGDDVYLRPLAKKGQDDLSSLVHELGHRYWFKFASMDQKKAVIRLFGILSNKHVEVVLPKVGDEFPLPIHGEKIRPTITSIEGLKVNLSTGGYVDLMKMKKLMQEREVHTQFPSSYAAKNYEEFFAECFAHFTLGTLKPDLLAQFESALDGIMAPVR